MDWKVQEKRTGVFYIRDVLDDFCVTACKDYEMRKQRRCATFVGSTHSTFLSVSRLLHLFIFWEKTIKDSVGWK